MVAKRETNGRSARAPRSAADAGPANGRSGNRNSAAAPAEPATSEFASSDASPAATAQRVVRRSAVAAKLLREGSDRLFEQGKSRAARELSHLGAAVRRAAEKLEDQESAALAGYAGTAADALEGVAQYVGQQQLTDVAKSLGDLARRRPGFATAAVLLIGLAAGRFAKAGLAGGSDESREGESTEADAGATQSVRQAEPEVPRPPQRKRQKRQEAAD